MFRTSFSREGIFAQCPRKYQYRYVDCLEVLFNCDPMNPLVVGTALHECIELGPDEALARYKAKYPVMTDLMENECMKLSVLGARAAKVLSNTWGDGAAYETPIDCDGMVGFIDYLVQTGGHTWAMVDFKYSNNTDHYVRSSQLSVYKYFFELTHPGEIVETLAFLMVPKTMIRQKRTEDLYQFRERLKATLADMWPALHRVEYDPQAVADFLVGSIRMCEATDFLAQPSRLCDWCDYKDLCQGGNDLMILPKNERREAKPITAPDMWIYADSYVGKSTFVDHMDNVLFVNTDGNVSNITSPYVPIADELVTEGRMTRKVLAWAKFREVIDELEKHDNDFEVVALDLVEDLYEHCRSYVFEQLGIKHETDAGYGKGWDMVRTEFLGQMKRLKSLGYRVIYISKELVTEITYANGMKVSTFKPNINDKVANVLAGTVTMTLRAYMDERGHFLQLKKNENVFGGGRIDFKQDHCDLTVEAFDEALREAQGETAGVKPAKKRRAKKVEDATSDTEAHPEVEVGAEASEHAPEATPEPETAPEEQEKPKRRVRKRHVATAE